MIHVLNFGKLSGTTRKSLNLAPKSLLKTDYEWFGNIRLSLKIFSDQILHSFLSILPLEPDLGWTRRSFFLQIQCQKENLLKEAVV